MSDFIQITKLKTYTILKKQAKQYAMYLYSTKIEYFKYEINIKDIIMGITKINANI